VQEWVQRFAGTWVEVLFLVILLAVTLAFGLQEVNSIYGGF
jgi:succinate dehydrogenase hydrophobic anchor subunit